MTQAGFKWFCSNCGNIKYGEKPPKFCSICKSLGSDFYKTQD